MIRLMAFDLLICLSTMLSPAADMPSCRIVMCPTDQAALLVPDKFSEKANCVANFYLSFPRSKIYVVLNYYFLSRGNPNDKSLIERSFIVVRQYSRNNTLAST